MTAAKVRIHKPAEEAQETESQRVVATAKKKTAEVKDSLGRTIKIKRMGPLDQMRLARVVGADNAKNDRYLGYAVLAASVMEIDGEPEPPANSARELEALVDRLEEEGLTAVAEGHQTHFDMGNEPLLAPDVKN